MSDLVVRTRGMTRKFGEVTAVNQVDLEISKGMIYGFLGPNGCGKTTSMRMLTGLLTPTSGELEVLGNTLPRDAENLKYRIGYMTQTFSLYRDLSVTENLQFFSKIFGLGRKQERRRIEDLLDIYDLTDLANADELPTGFHWQGEGQTGGEETPGTFAAVSGSYVELDPEEY